MSRHQVTTDQSVLSVTSSQQRKLSSSGNDSNGSQTNWLGQSDAEKTVNNDTDKQHVASDSGNGSCTISSPSTSVNGNASMSGSSSASGDGGQYMSTGGGGRLEMLKLRLKGGGGGGIRKQALTTSSADDDMPSPGPNSQSAASNGHHHSHPDVGVASHAGARNKDKADGKLLNVLFPDKSHAAKVAKRASLKEQKKTYRSEKKRAAKELLSTLSDPLVIVMADWLKVRGTLKGWTKLWCVLKPGLLMLFKSDKQKSSQWVGTVLLNSCELLERPSKKDGFCFKLFHPLDQSIWATKGPKGENLGAIIQPLPYSYLIFRAPSEAAGKCWMDALELALKCSSLLIKTMAREREALGVEVGSRELATSEEAKQSLRRLMNESDCEQHFRICGLEDDSRNDREDDKEAASESESDKSDDEEKLPSEHEHDPDLAIDETHFTEDACEDVTLLGTSMQTEEIAEENKSIVWALIKQVRPGMDLSRVVLPTFILEPCSFLEKLADYYYHADILSEAATLDDPYSRMKSVVRWYFSGFYKKPRGPKKPYNPVLGETFRCYWAHPRTGSRTFYIAEQISHHPPVTALHLTNRKDGFSFSGTILARSKFYGNSLSAILDGNCILTFLSRGEDYRVTLPYAHCKGVLIGTLTMELGGKVDIVCEKTGYRTEIEFKLKPFLGGGEASNSISGKLKLGDETLATLDGHWDGEIYIKERGSQEKQLLWCASPEVKQNRLKRFSVPIDEQSEFESGRLWQRLREALKRNDQQMATEEKLFVEDAQRQMARERKAKMEDWIPKYFVRDETVGQWVYKYSDLRPWDPLNDVYQYEHAYCIQTKTRHRVNTGRNSIANLPDAKAIRIRKRMSRQSTTSQSTSPPRVASTSSTQDGDPQARGDTDSSESYNGEEDVTGPVTFSKVGSGLEKTMSPLVTLQKELGVKVSGLQTQLAQVHRDIASLSKHHSSASSSSFSRDLFIVMLIFILQTVLFWLF